MRSVSLVASMHRAGSRLGREDAHVDVGHELAQQDHAVALLDEAGDLLAAQGALVDAGEQRMPLADHALAEHRGGDRDAGPLGKLQQRALQAEAVDLDAGQDDRPLGGGDAPGRLAHRLAKRLGVAGRLLARGTVRAVGNHATMSRGSSM